jgi:hypothetical protein
MPAVIIIGEVVSIAYPQNHHLADSSPKIIGPTPTAPRITPTGPQKSAQKKIVTLFEFLRVLQEFRQPDIRQRMLQ